MILTDRIELLEQSGGTLEAFGLTPTHLSKFKSTDDFKSQLIMGMTQTLIRRLKGKGASLYHDMMDSTDLIIIDECHKQTFNTVQEHMSDKTIVIGATATPLRVGNQKSLDKFYQAIVEEVTISSLIQNRFLAVPRYFEQEVDLSGIKKKGNDYDENAIGDKFSEIKLYEGVIENYLELCPKEKAVIFSANVKSSKEIVDEFCKKGILARHIDGNTPKAEREAALRWFEKTDGAVISNVGILNAGWDAPTCQVVILYRATLSESLYLQMVGRGARTTDTKKSFKVLDFGMNARKHGHWHSERTWNLVKKKRQKGLAPTMFCPECEYICPVSAKICLDPDCRFLFTEPVKTKKEKEFARLKEMKPDDLIELLKNASFEDLNNIQEARGYKKTWIFHQLDTEEKIFAYADEKGYKKGWSERQIERLKVNALKRETDETFEEPEKSFEETMGL